MRKPARHARREPAHTAAWPDAADGGVPPAPPPSSPPPPPLLPGASAAAVSATVGLLLGSGDHKAAVSTAFPATPPRAAGADAAPQMPATPAPAGVSTRRRMAAASGAAPKHAAAAAGTLTCDAAAGSSAAAAAAGRGSQGATAGRASAAAAAQRRPAAATRRASRPASPAAAAATAFRSQAAAPGRRAAAPPPAAVQRCRTASPPSAAVLLPLAAEPQRQAAGELLDVKPLPPGAPPAAAAAAAAAAGSDAAGGRQQAADSSSGEGGLVDELVAVMKRTLQPYEVNDLSDSMMLQRFDEGDGKSRKGPVGSSSRYRGVTRHRRTRRWEAHIWHIKKQVYLGGFDNEVQAAKAHDVMAIKTRGPRTIINFKLSVYEAVMGRLTGTDTTWDELVSALRTSSRKLAVKASPGRRSAAPRPHRVVTSSSAQPHARAHGNGRAAPAAADADADADDEDYEDDEEEEQGAGRSRYSSSSSRRLMAAAPGRRTAEDRDYSPANGRALPERARSSRVGSRTVHGGGSGLQQPPVPNVAASATAAAPALAAAPVGGAARTHVLLPLGPGGRPLPSSSAGNVGRHSSSGSLLRPPSLPLPPLQQQHRQVTGQQPAVSPTLMGLHDGFAAPGQRHSSSSSLAALREEDALLLQPAAAPAAVAHLAGGELGLPSLLRGSGGGSLATSPLLEAHHADAALAGTPADGASQQQQLPPGHYGGLPPHLLAPPGAAAGGAAADVIGQLLAESAFLGQGLPGDAAGQQQHVFPGGSASGVNGRLLSYPPAALLGGGGARSALLPRAPSLLAGCHPGAGGSSLLHPPSSTDHQQLTKPGLSLFPCPGGGGGSNRAAATAAAQAPPGALAGLLHGGSASSAAAWQLPPGSQTATGHLMVPNNIQGSMAAAPQMQAAEAAAVMAARRATARDRALDGLEYHHHRQRSGDVQPGGGSGGAVADAAAAAAAAAQQLSLAVVGPPPDLPSPHDWGAQLRLCGLLQPVVPLLDGLPVDEEEEAAIEQQLLQQQAWQQQQQQPGRAPMPGSTSPARPASPAAVAAAAHGSNAATPQDSPQHYHRLLYPGAAHASAAGLAAATNEDSLQQYQVAIVAAAEATAQAELAAHAAYAGALLQPPAAADTCAAAGLGEVQPSTQLHALPLAAAAAAAAAAGKAAATAMQVHERLQQQSLQLLLPHLHGAKQDAPLHQLPAPVVAAGSTSDTTPAAAVSVQAGAAEAEGSVPAATTGPGQPQQRCLSWAEEADTAAGSPSSNASQQQQHDVQESLQLQVQVLQQQQDMQPSVQQESVQLQVVQQQQQQQHHQVQHHSQQEASQAEQRGGSMGAAVPCAEAAAATSL